MCWIPGREAWIRDLKVAQSLPSRECKMIDRLSGMPDENSKSWRVTYIDIPSRPTGWALTKRVPRLEFRLYFSQNNKP